MDNNQINQDPLQPSTLPGQTDTSSSPPVTHTSSVHTFIKNHKLLIGAVVAAILVATSVSFFAFAFNRPNGSDTTLPSPTPTQTSRPTPPSTTDTPPLPTQPNPTSQPESECVSDNDCGAFNCIQAPCPKLACINNKCIVTDGPVCGDNICEDIEKNCRSTHPISMDCGKYYCEGDCNY